MNSAAEDLRQPAEAESPDRRDDLFVIPLRQKNDHVTNAMH